MNKISNILIADPLIVVDEIRHTAKKSCSNADEIRTKLLESTIRQNSAFQRLDDRKLTEYVLVCLAYSSLNPETVFGLRDSLERNLSIILQELELQGEDVAIVSSIEGNLLESFDFS